MRPDFQEKQRKKRHKSFHKLSTKLSSLMASLQITRLNKVSRSSSSSACLFDPPLFGSTQFAYLMARNSSWAYCSSYPLLFEHGEVGGPSNFQFETTFVLCHTRRGWEWERRCREQQSELVKLLLARGGGAFALVNDGLCQLRIDDSSSSSSSPSLSLHFAFAIYSAQLATPPLEGRISSPLFISPQEGHRCDS